MSTHARTDTRRVSVKAASRTVAHPPARRACRRQYRWLSLATIALVAATTVITAPVRGQQDATTQGERTRRVVLPKGRLEQLLVNLPHETAVATACVVDVENSLVVYGYQRELGVVPASTMKLFTMVAALETLGADFVYRTRFLKNESDLVVVGDGDPSTGNAAGRYMTQKRDGHFQPLIEKLKQHNVGNIPGDLVVDVSMFEPPAFHEHWEESDHGRWYAAPVDAVNFNANCVDITLSPTTPGQPAKVDIWPACPDAEIDNRVKTGEGRNPIVHHPPGTRKYVLSGNCRKPWAFPAVSFPEPGLLYGHALLQELRSAEINVAGKLRVSRTPVSLQSAEMIGEMRTPLLEILPQIGKDSHGPYSEALLKRTGLALSGHGDNTGKGSWKAGRRAVDQLLNKARIDGKRFVMSDGSGLSRENRCTAQQLCDLLSFVHRRSYADKFAESLSIAGTDGTLRRQLREQAGRVVGKTGTMTGIRTLAGYVQSSTGQRKLAFAIMFNDFPGSTSPYRDIQDDFCKTLIQAVDW